MIKCSCSLLFFCNRLYLLYDVEQMEVTKAHIAQNSVVIVLRGWKKYNQNSFSQVTFVIIMAIILSSRHRYKLPLNEIY